MGIMVCEAPCKLDRAVSKILNRVGYPTNSHMCAFMRTSYNNTHKNAPLIYSEGDFKNKSKEEIESEALAVAAKLLANENSIINLEDYHDSQERAKVLGNLEKALVNYTQNLVDNVDNNEESEALEEKITPDIIYDRVNLIKDHFRDIVDSLVLESGLSRKEVLNGVVIDGYFNYGLFYIFEKVRESILSKYKNTNAEDSINLLLRNDKWNGIIPLVIQELQTLEEGMSLKNNKDGLYDNTIYSETNDGSFADGETTREHWQTVSATIDPFKSAPAQVRSLVDRLTLNEGSEQQEDFDDLGHRKRNDTVKILEELREICRGCRNSKQMMDVISKSNFRYSNSLISLLQSDPKLQTLFFKATKKSFIEYCKVTLKNVLNSAYSSTLYHLNRRSDKTFYKAHSKIVTTKKIYALGKNAIFEADGRIIKSNLDKVIERIDSLFKVKKEQVSEGSMFAKVTPALWTSKSFKATDKILVVQELLGNVGVTVSEEIAMKIISSGQVYKLQEAIRGFIEKLKKNNRNNIVEDLSNYSTVTSEIQDAYASIYKIIDPIINTEVKRAVRTKNDKDKSITMFSDVNSSFLTNLYEDIHFYLKQGNYEGLRSYLDNKFLNSRQFKYNDEILNTWIKDLYDNCDKSEFDFDTWKIKRVLSLEDTVVENVFRRDHHIIGFTAYLEGKNKVRRISRQAYNSAKNKNTLSADTNYIVTDDNSYTTSYYYKNGEWIEGNNDYAHYPIFTLGDNGGMYFIKQKTLSRQQIIDNLVKVFYSEVHRMKDSILAQETLEERLKNDNPEINNNVVKEINNIHKVEYTFTLLDFLNDSKYSSIIFGEGNTIKDFIHDRDFTIDDLENKVKQAITLAMDDLAENNWNKMEQDQFLAKNENGEYLYLDKHIKKEIGEDDKNITSEMYESTAKNLVYDYIYNNIFSNIQQFQIHIIDPGFFKGSKDLQKRYKAMLASGTSLDITAKDPSNSDVNISDGIERCFYFHDPVTSAEKTNPEFAKAIAYQYGKSTDNYQKWEAQNPNADKETKEQKAIEYGKTLGIYKKYMDNPTADGQGYRSITGYRKVMVMSGQWTDTMENWYQNLLEYRKIEDKESVEAIQLLHDIQNAMVVFQPIKPLLMDVENLKLKDGGNFKIPVFHKYAEIPLIPELLPKGSALRDMAEFMEENNIDMCGAWSTGGDTIVKSGGFGSINIQPFLSGNSNTSLKDALSGAYVHELHYENYIIQTNVPNHSIDFRAVGTQIRKLITSGMMVNPNAIINGITSNNKLCIKDGEYVDSTGDNTMAYYNSIVVANIMDSLQGLLDKLAIEDKQKLSELLSSLKYANDRTAITSLIYGLTLDEDSNFNVPLFEGFSEFDNISTLISFFKNNVLKQQILGGSAVQASSFGICDYQESGDLQYELDENNNILWAECEVPFDLFYTDSEGNRVNLNYDDYCNSDGTLIMGENGISKLENEFPGMLDIIAYRVPTEQEYSMMNLKVKRFTRPIMGGVIKVPAPAVTTAGFDFDIDKLYFIRKEFKTSNKAEEAKKEFLSNKNNVKDVWESIYNIRVSGNTTIGEVLAGARGENIDELYKYWDKLYDYWNNLAEEDRAISELPKNHTEFFNKEVNKRFETKWNDWEKYDHSQTAFKQSRVSRNNAMFDLMRARLMSPETFNRRTTPGGFSTARKTALQLRILKFGDIDSNTTLEDSRRLSENADNDPEPNYSAIDPYTQIIYNQQNQIAAKVIGTMANHCTGYSYSCLADSWELVKGIQFGKATSERKDLLNKRDFNKIFSILAEFLAASVDAVKDPVLKDLNINTLTANIAASLARLGYDLEDIGLLLNQPIIKEVCDYAFTEGVSLNVAISEIRKNKNKINKNIQYNPDLILDTNFLFNSIKKDRLDPNYSNNSGLASQMHVLELFENINTIAGHVSKFNMALKNTAANSVSSSFGGYYAHRAKMQDLVETLSGGTVMKFSKSRIGEEFNNVPLDLNVWSVLAQSPQDYFMHKSIYKNPFAYEQAMYDALEVFMYNLAEEFPYENSMYVHSRSRLHNLTRYGGLKEEHINSIHRDLPLYYLSQISGSNFDPTAECAIEITNSKGDAQKNINNKYFYTVLFPKVLNFLQNAEGRKISRIQSKLSTFLDQLIIKTDKKRNQRLAIYDNSYINTIQLELASYINDDTTINAGVNTIKTVGDQDEGVTYNIEMSVGDIVKGLFFYNIFNNGFNTSSISKFMPANIFSNIKIFNTDNSYSYVDILKNIQKNRLYTIDTVPFTKMFILNNSKDNTFTLTPRSTTKKNIINSMQATANKPAHLDYFSITIAHSKKDKSSNKNIEFLLDNPKYDDFGNIMSTEWVSCVNIDGNLYMAVADINSDEGADFFCKGLDNADLTTKVIYNEEFNIKENNVKTMYYVKVDARNIDGKHISYNPEYYYATSEETTNTINDSEKNESSIESVVSGSTIESSVSNIEIENDNTVVYTVDVESIYRSLEDAGIPISKTVVSEVCKSIQKFKNDKRVATENDGKNVIVKNTNGEIIEMC